MAEEDDDLDEVIAQEAPDDLRSVLEKAIEDQETGVASGEIRARGPDGKFLKAEPTSDTDATPPTTEARDPPPPKDTSDLKPDVKPVEAKSTTEPPANWPEADKAVFRSLPAEAQTILLKRQSQMDADYSRKTMEIADLRRDFDPVRQVLAPHMETIRSKGLSPATLFDSWVKAEQMLGAGGDTAIGFIKNLLPLYRIDPIALSRALGGGAPPPSQGQRPSEPPSPAPDGSAPIALPPELLSELHTLKDKQGAMDRFLQQQAQQQQQEKQNRVMSTITEFRNAKDASGALLHPHYDELEDTMVRLLGVERASGKEPTLDELYSTAVWANPSTRDKTLAEKIAAEAAQRKTAADKTREEARAKAERARKAGSSVTGAPGSGQARVGQVNGGRSLRQELEGAYEEVVTS